MEFNFLRFFVLLYFWILSYALSAQNNAQAYRLNIKRMDEKIRLDGMLDEPFWEDLEIATNFWMNFPVGGTPVDDEVQTSVKIAYDDDFIYIGVVVFSEVKTAWARYGAFFGGVWRFKIYGRICA